MCKNALKHILHKPLYAINMNIFEKIADKLKKTENDAYNKNETSFDLFEISHCTDTSIIGRDYPQVDFIDLEKAHSINYHNKPNTFEFDKITLYKTAKLTDVISTAAISAHGFMLSKKALDIFTSQNIGKFCIYPANLIHKGASYKYCYLTMILQMKSTSNNQLFSLPIF